MKKSVFEKGLLLIIFEENVVLDHFLFRTEYLCFVLHQNQFRFLSSHDALMGKKYGNTNEIDIRSFFCITRKNTDYKTRVLRVIIPITVLFLRRSAPYLHIEPHIITSYITGLSRKNIT